MFLSSVHVTNIPPETYHKILNLLIYLTPHFSFSPRCSQNGFKLNHFSPHLHMHPRPKYHHLLPDNSNGFLTGFSCLYSYPLLSVLQAAARWPFNQINVFQRLLGLCKIKPEIFTMAYKALSELTSNYLSVIPSLPCPLLWTEPSYTG